MWRLIRAFGYSLEGLIATFRSEPTFRIEIIAFAVFFPLAWWVEVESNTSRALLISTLLLVLLAELANTAIESVINRISADIHPLSKKAKDVGSAMVLIALINAGLVWGIVLWPQISTLISF